MKDTSKEFLESFFRSSRKLKVRNGAEWIKKVIEEEHEEEYGSLISKWKRARRLIK